MCSSPLMPRPTETMRSRLREIDRLLRFPERRLGLLADRRRRRAARLRTVTGARPFCTASARNAPIWNVTKCGAGPVGTTSAASLPWNIGRVNAQPPALGVTADAVGHERAVEARRERGAKSRAW